MYIHINIYIIHIFKTLWWIFIYKTSTTSLIISLGQILRNKTFRFLYNFLLDSKGALFFREGFFFKASNLSLPRCCPLVQTQNSVNPYSIFFSKERYWHPLYFYLLIDNSFLSFPLYPFPTCAQLRLFWNKMRWYVLISPFSTFSLTNSTLVPSLQRPWCPRYN